MYNIFPAGGKIVNYEEGQFNLKAGRDSGVQPNMEFVVYERCYLVCGKVALSSHRGGEEMESIKRVLHYCNVSLCSSGKIAATEIA